MVFFNGGNGDEVNTSRNSSSNCIFTASISRSTVTLLRKKHGLTLIDAALPFCAKKILEAARKIGKPITNIVINTCA